MKSNTFYFNCFQLYHKWSFVDKKVLNWVITLCKRNHQQKYTFFYNSYERKHFLTLNYINAKWFNWSNFLLLCHVNKLFWRHDCCKLCNVVAAMVTSNIEAYPIIYKLFHSLFRLIFFAWFIQQLSGPPHQKWSKAFCMRKRWIRKNFSLFLFSPE